MTPKNYITRTGYNKLEAEFNQLLKVERPQVVRTVAWAASNGDRSENADYIYGKRRLRQIDSRLRFLMQRLELAEVVESTPHSEQVFFGATVTVFDLDTKSEHRFRIVGQDELDPTQGEISWASPLARALLGKRLGDNVKVVTPQGKKNFEIIDIMYAAS